MANQDIVNAWGLTNRALPGPVVDNQYGPMRLSRRGELFTAGDTGKWRYNLCDEGTYFSGKNGTIDAATTLAGHAAPVLADLYTKPLVHIRNEGASTSLVRTYLDFIEIEVITAGANGTSDNWAAELDTGASRYSSGTVETMTPVNTNMQSTTTAVTVVKAGPFVAAAATASQRKVGHGVFRPAIALTGDKYTFRFGDEQNSGYNVVATATTHHVVGLPPCILGPTDQFLLHLYAPSQNAAAVYKVRYGLWER